MIDAFSKIFDVMSMANNYESRKVDRTDVGRGITVSTVFATDYRQYETAIFDANGKIYPVERYDTIEESKIGHKKWCKDIVNMNKITRLGYFDIADDEEIILIRNEQ